MEPIFFTRSHAGAWERVILECSDLGRLKKTGIHPMVITIWESVGVIINRPPQQIRVLNSPPDYFLNKENYN